MMKLYLPFAIVAYVCADYNETGCLPCTARVEQGLKYRKVSWYKVELGVLTGLILKNLNTGKTSLYKSANHTYQIRADFSLLLPTPAVVDCGSYRCMLWPPLGHQIQEGDYSFYTTGCTKPTPSLLKEDRLTQFSASSQKNFAVTVGISGGLSLLIIVILLVAVAVWSRRRTQLETYTKLQVETLG